MVRLALHVVITTAGWAFFGYFWFVVIRRGWYSKGIPLALIMMGVFITLLLVVTGIWVRHNIAIGRKNRRRGAPVFKEGIYLKDKTGLDVVIADMESIKGSAVIEISIENGKKVIEAATDGG